jgi:hypothetical protein
METVMNSSIAKYLGALVLGTAFLAGCSVTHGSGVVTTEQRAAASFEEIETRQVNVRVVVDPTATTKSLEVTGDDNLVPMVRTRNDGNRLVIDLNKGEDIDPHAGLTVIVRTPKLTYIKAEQRAHVDATLDGPGTLKLDANSESSITGHGKVARLNVNVTGSAKIRARDLVAKDVDLEASGSSDAEVCATDSLVADIGGNADASYYCSPKHVERDVGGGGSLEKK